MIQTTYTVDIQGRGDISVRGDDDSGVTLRIDFNIGPDAPNGTDLPLRRAEAEELLQALHLAYGRGEL